MKTFRQVLWEAIRHFAENGFTSGPELADWMHRLRTAADYTLPPEDVTHARIRREFETIFARTTKHKNLVKRVPGVSRYTIERVNPHLRAELDRRILAATDLIKLNRDAAIQKTLQRFSGWSTAIPAGALTDAEKRDAAKDIGKGIAQAKFEQRRVAIDQGHKLMANVADIVAREDGAIAAIWHSHWRQKNYDYREDHKERDEHVYLIRDSWAHQSGLVKKGKVGYLDDITQPGQEPFCRCFCEYVTSLNRLPEDMLTKKGREALADMRAA